MGLHTTKEAILFSFRSILLYLHHFFTLPLMSPLASFSPAPRRRDSLLASLEKKAIPTGMIIFAPSGADPQLSCDLISALTDADMEIIENYASRLEEALVGDAEDAYAIAMDAFVRG